MPQVTLSLNSCSETKLFYSKASKSLFDALVAAICDHRFRDFLYLLLYLQLFDGKEEILKYSQRLMILDSFMRIHNLSGMYPFPMFSFLTC